MDSRILIIDKDKSLLSKLKEYIVQNGYNVKTSISPYMGLELAIKENFPVILFNYDFNVMTGTEFLKSILNHNPKTRVIIMTEDNDSNKILECIELGAFDFIKKPIGDFSVLKKLIEMSFDKAEKWNKFNE